MNENPDDDDNPEDLLSPCPNAKADAPVVGVIPNPNPVEAFDVDAGVELGLVDAAPKPVIDNEGDFGVAA